MTHIDPLLIKFTGNERAITRTISGEHDVPEAKFIRESIKFVVSNPKAFKLVLREARRQAEKKEAVK